MRGLPKYPRIRRGLLILGVEGRAFTLLEAVLAMAILAAVTVVCVGLRAQSLAAGVKIELRLGDERETQAIFEMVTNGLLPPAEVGEDSLVKRWRGEHLGAEYTLKATRETLVNPMYSSERPESAGLSERIVMWRYVLSFRGRETEFMWHR